MKAKNCIYGTWTALTAAAFLFGEKPLEAQEVGTIDYAYSPVSCLQQGPSLFTGGSVGLDNRTSEIPVVYCGVVAGPESAVYLDDIAVAAVVVYGYANAYESPVFNLCRVYAAGGGGVCGTSFYSTVTNANYSASQYGDVPSANSPWTGATAGDGYFIKATLLPEWEGVGQQIFGYTVSTETTE